MSLKGIDISKWQEGISVGALDVDFVICKATEGIGYVDPQCDIVYQKAEKAGRLMGVYHFAHPENNPVSEANFFVDNILGYVGKAILVLDYETNTNVSWAKKWLDQVKFRTGVNPMIYMSESTVNSADWTPICGTYGLWVAKYRDNSPDSNFDMSNAGNPPNISDWSFYAMWQWTSSGRLNGYNGDLDCNEFYGDANAWLAYAKSPIPTPPPIINPPVVIPPVPVVEPPKPVEPPIVVIPPVIEPSVVITPTDTPQPVASTWVSTPQPVILKKSLWQLIIDCISSIIKLLKGDK